ncbi:DUF3307 domain-containing protein [Halodesulfovibrio marinisediminis]|uniref:DUF3307 domain-containing protein n=1 Tax=Halodesulfovibrio marinisediminis DSM 17456 TaxID=1121457 RepID=A0A1N6DP05_9BACT|nr:DUF3307 domain-containing protein [Halodesulfovibrio marinisediminis]SIN72538.1 Protein of unknown function [Halodesulfovibrio marinisediminis DSM 17456]
MSIPNLNWLLLLLIGHFLADFLFQKDAWVAEKNEKHFAAPSLYIHVLLHAVFSGLIVFAFYAAQDAKAFLPSLGAAAVICISHLGIDLAKTYAQKNTLSFLLDQLLHLVVIVGLWMWITAQGGVVVELVKNANYTKWSLLFLAYFVLYMPTGILIGMLLQKWAPQNGQVGQTRDDAVTADSLKQAGKWIGYLERTLILTFVITNHISAVGFLFAAKSIFRFGELSNAEHVIKTEYVLLGTLYSYTCSLLVGFAVQRLL